MGKSSVFASLAELLQKKKNLRIAAYVGISLLVLILFLTSGVFRACETARSEPAQEAKTETDSGYDRAKIEARLEEALSMMAGVGRTKVMLELDSTAQQVVAMDDSSTSGTSGTSTQQRPATVSSGGKESPIVLTELLPKVRGVIVIAEGAGNISVRLNIIRAVSTVLGIDENCVEVFVMTGSPIE